jgi:hypothetical protein
MSFFKPSGISSRLGLYVLIILLSNTSNVPCSLSVRDQALYYTEQQRKLLFCTFSGKFETNDLHFFADWTFDLFVESPNISTLPDFLRTWRNKMISVPVVLWLYCDKLGNTSNRLVTAELLAACFMLVSFLAYSSTLKLEGPCSSEASVDFHWTIRPYIPEDRTL